MNRKGDPRAGTCEGVLTEMEESDMKRGQRVKLNHMVLDILKSSGLTVRPRIVDEVSMHYLVGMNHQYLGSVIMNDDGSARIELPASSIFKGLTDVPSELASHVHDKCTDEGGPEHVPACIICEKEVELRDGLCADHYGELVDLIANES